MTSTQIHMGPETPIVGSLLRSLAKNWWLLLLRGLAAIAFGVLAFIWPDLTLLSLTLIWGIYAISDGILALATAIAGGHAPSSTRWWLALVGVCGILAGVGTFLMPGLTALVLLMIIASWAIIIGVLQIWGAIQLRKEIDNEWILILSGLLSLAFGILVMVMPGAGALSVVWTIGWFAVLIGCMYVGLAIRLRKFMLQR